MSSAQRILALGCAWGLACAQATACSVEPHFQQACVGQDFTVCEGADTFCRVRACVNGGCELMPTNEGKELPVDPLPFNCQKSVCNSVGEPIEEPDDDDFPETTVEPCKTERCDDGVLIRENLPEGTACGVGLTCDNDGKCYGCTEPADCGAATPCYAFECNASLGLCAFVPHPDATLEQVADDDCLMQACDPNGNSVSLPDDGEGAETDSSLCNYDYCAGGAPYRPNKPDGTACGAQGCCKEGGCEIPCD